MQEETISPQEHIRKRPGMYIGDIRLKGVQQMLEYLFEDQLKLALSDPILEVDFLPDNVLCIITRNINTHKYYSYLEGLCVNNNTANWLGSAVLVALSDEIRIEINSSTSVITLSGQKGRLKVETSTSLGADDNVKILYKLDREIFKTVTLIYEYFIAFFQQFAILNPGLKIITRDNSGRELQRNIYYYPKGILERFRHYLLACSSCIASVELDTILQDYSCKIGIAYAYSWPQADEPIQTYANNINTYLGGSLHDGVIKGIVAALKKLAQERDVEVLVNKKNVKNNLIIMAAIKGDNLEFVGSVRRKIDMPEVEKDVKRIVTETLLRYLKANEDVAKATLKQFQAFSV